MNKKFDDQINLLIQEAQNLSNTGLLEKDNLLSQAYKQIEVILKLNKLLDEKLFELTVINEIGGIIRSVEDYDEVMKSILAILKTILQYEIGGVVLLEKNEMELYINITQRVGSLELDDCKNKIFLAQEWRDISKTINKSTIIKEIIIGDTNIVKDNKIAKRQIFFNAIPLEIRSKIIGLIFIANFGQDITEHYKNTLTMVANQAILVINNCQLYHRMKDMAIHDGLTGLFNHRYFQDSLEKEIFRAARHK